MKALMLLALAPLLAAAAPDPGWQRAQLGLELAAWARAKDDPDGLLVAARLLLDARVRPGKTDRGAVVADPAQRDIAIQLADEAQAMRPGDARIATAAQAVRDAVPRGFSGGPSGAGPIVLRQRLGAHAALAWTAQARGNEMAIVSAVGDGDTDIDLEVADSRGRKVCADAAGDYHPMCRWSVPRATAYRIRVINRGALPSDVTILSN